MFITNCVTLVMYFDLRYAAKTVEVCDGECVICDV